MKKQFLLYALLACSLGACRTLRVQDYHTNQSISPRLPRLGLLIHERSFGEAFDYSPLNFEAYGEPTSPWIAYQFSNQQLNDVFDVLGNELDDNLNQPLSTIYGHARFKLLHYQLDNAGFGWLLLSVSTLMIPNLFGMPLSSCQTEMDLQMEIVDANDKVLVSYTALGTGKAKIAAYHGYDPQSAVRKANLLALQNAMFKIKRKLQEDAPTLSSELEAAGAVKKIDSK